MKKSFIILLSIIKIVAVDAQAPELKKASDHAMQYYFSLTKGWTANKKWPVVIAVETADKQFEQNAERFIAVRKICLL